MESPESFAKLHGKYDFSAAQSDELKTNDKFYTKEILTAISVWGNESTF
jgi:hypothetical protein